MAETIIKLFTDEPQVIYYGIQCLQYVCLGYVIYAYGMVITQSFNGAGDTRTPIAISESCLALISIAIFRRGNWKLVKV
jgi:Na+-driven multidrug efflux pump